jgi:MoxR-like ATPase
LTDTGARAPELVEFYAKVFDAVTKNVAQVLEGKDEPVRLTLMCMAARGHVLLEDVPGVGKTTLAKALAHSLGLEWHRIQFTPDLLPSDVTGVNIFEREQGSFRFRPGGVFANILLGDEINRASPKTQAALLEAMQERQVTVDSITRALPSPFLVIATQNPVEHAGTYPLPEAQLDRFLLRIGIGYPAHDAEVDMLSHHGTGPDVDHLPAVVEPNAVALLMDVTSQIYVADSVKHYIVNVAEATRAHPSLALGMSPRASLALQQVARAHAASLGRSYVIPDDVKALSQPVLGHRLKLTPTERAAGTPVSEVIDEVFRVVSAPKGDGPR